MSKVSVRAAKTADIPMIVSFNAGIANETENINLDEQRLEKGVSAILADQSKGQYFMAEIDGKVVGQAMFTTEWSDWRNGDFWWFQSVYVKASARRLGVFRALYKYVEKAAQARDDVCGLRLYVDAHNDRAISTYTNLGMSRSNYQIMEVDFRLNRKGQK